MSSQIHKACQNVTLPCARVGRHGSISFVVPGPPAVSQTLGGSLHSTVPADVTKRFGQFSVPIASLISYSVCFPLRLILSNGRLPQLQTHTSLGHIARQRQCRRAAPWSVVFRPSDVETEVEIATPDHVTVESQVGREGVVKRTWDPTGESVPREGVRCVDNRSAMKAAPASNRLKGTNAEGVARNKGRWVPLRFTLGVKATGNFNSHFSPS